MKSKKLNLLVTFLVVLSLVLSSTVCASAATVKINKKSLTIYAGKTATVKMLNTSKKVTWSSSKKAVATVKSTGRTSAKITAKKAGTATITAKVGAKKYTCKVTVKNAVGSRKNPADPTKGVTIKTDFGTMQFKLTGVYRGPEAISLFKEYDPESWDYYEEYELTDYLDYELIGLEYEVAAKAGYDEYPLIGADIISAYGLYNGDCNTSISNFYPLYFLNKNENLDASSLSLYGGGSSKMFAFFLIPPGTKEFSNRIYTESFDQYWIKYSI